MSKRRYAETTTAWDQDASRWASSKWPSTELFLWGHCGFYVSTPHRSSLLSASVCTRPISRAYLRNYLSNCLQILHATPQGGLNVLFGVAAVLSHIFTSVPWHNYMFCHTLPEHYLRSYLSDCLQILHTPPRGFRMKCLLEVAVLWFAIGSVLWPT